ncbi:MAG: ATP-binding protein, partial [Bacteroidales bacterium]|nr:ATP-binding protein [Bacteroidales bacterium]
MASFFVERLIATGPGRTDSIIEFVPGLNIIHASSESGKTMAANSIAYAFGCSKVPFLPETTDGYDSVEIQLRSQNGFLTKISRHINDDYVHVASENPSIKEDTYSLEYPKDDDNTGKKKKDPLVLNTLLLKLIGLDCVPLIGANGRSDKKRLTWKNFFRVLYLDKEKIGLDEYVIEPRETYERTLL